MGEAGIGVGRPGDDAIQGEDEALVGLSEGGASDQVCAEVLVRRRAA